ncbi:MAG: hypothetical protein BIFFINMI_02144 [Phycisphaerae bacterium]|nr:hypothetical protein [Phycisphaerae bacterium]
MKACLFLAAVLSSAAATWADGAAPAANEWTQVSDGDLGPGFSPGLVWSADLKRFVFFCGAISHSFTGERPYDVLSLDPADKAWRNELPAGAEDRGGPTGNVKDPGFKSPFYAFGDDAKLARPNRRHLCMWYQYAIAPWDGKVYMLICGRVLCYDPRQRTWKETGAPAGPMLLSGSHRAGLSWSALCADPVNREILLFGGCGLVTTPDGSPGTWVYSPEANAWRRLDLKAEPPPRALSPMAFDPATRKIVLFGGDGLDRLYADTWAYDCATRTWEQRKPALSPSPRFGHALLRPATGGGIVLLGGKGYRSSTDYCATLYRPLPFEVWTYDVAADRWRLVRHYEKDGPADYVNRGGADSAAVAAVDDADTVVWIGPGTAKGSAHSAWRCRLDASRPDEEGSAKHGVKPGTIEYRTGPFDPEWYARDLPAPDPAAAEAALANLKPNTWTAPKCPRWPANRQGGGWSTATLDSDRDQILQMGGGHSSYFGNDVTHYDIRTGRWSIACRPQFALEYNYDLNGPGLWAFNGAPWGNHNYHAYAYDPTIRRIVYIKGDMTLLYDPVTRTWPFEEKFGKLPFYTSKYVNYLVTTPGGVICWTQYAYGSAKTGLWRLEGGKAWKELKLSGDPLPPAVCDGSTITYDSKRDRLLFTTTAGKDKPHGQVWSADLKTGQVKALDPAGMNAITGSRFARESAYLPGCDLVMFGFLLAGENGVVVPFYDCDKNRWLTAAMPGADFINGKRKAEPGSSVDLGLVYDPKRDLVWGVLCGLRGEGALQVVKVDAATLNAGPLADAPAGP